VARFDYTTAGHVTVDVLPDGSTQPGGGAFYSALQASRLGLRALVVTRGRSAELERLLEPYAAELELDIQPARHTTSLQSCAGDTAATQRVLAWAGPLEPPTAVDSEILHFAPVARETGRHWRGRASFIGLTPQGLIRSWQAIGEQMRPSELSRDQLPEDLDAVVLSDRERACCGVLFAPAGAPGRRAEVSDPGHGKQGDDATPLVAVTAAHRPTVLHLREAAPLTLAVPRVQRVVDDVGAGDVFAAAFFCALATNGAPADAAAFANAAAAVRLSGAGADAVGTRAAIEQRIHSAARA
jgi:sugar/nucleoside kinase (ribokinase family)